MCMWYGTIFQEMSQYTHIQCLNVLLTCTLSCLVLFFFYPLCSVARQTVRPGTPPDFILKVCDPIIIFVKTVSIELTVTYSEVPNNSIGQNNGIGWTNLQKLIIDDRVK